MHLRSLQRFPFSLPDPLFSPATSTSTTFVYNARLFQAHGLWPHQSLLWKQLCFHHTSLILILSQLNSFPFNFHFYFHCGHTTILGKTHWLSPWKEEAPSSSDLICACDGLEQGQTRKVTQAKQNKTAKMAGKATLASAERKSVMFAKWKKDQLRKKNHFQASESPPKRRRIKTTQSNLMDNT